MGKYLNKGGYPEVRPPVITIVGFPGSGKSSLAALFPNPVFIQTENSKTVFEQWPQDKSPFFMPQIPEPYFKDGKKISSYQVMLDQLQEIYDDDHDFQTLVIDTTSKFNYMCETEIVLFEGGDKSIQDCRGGFQKAYDRTSEMHREVIIKANKIRAKRNMTVVFLCHTDELKKKDSPDVTEQYTVYAMKMHKKCRDIYLAESDAVIYIKQSDTVTGVETDKKGKQIKSGRIKKSADRTLITSSDGVVGFVDAKNRALTMPTEIDFILDDQYKPWETKNPLFEYIPFFNGGNIKQEPQEPTTQEEENG